MFLKLILIKIDSLIDALKEIHEILLSFPYMSYFWMHMQPDFEITLRIC